MSAAATRARPAIFLDRDGTLIHDDGDLRRPADVRLYDSTLPVLAALQDDFELLIVTNQGAIADGRLTAAEVASVNDALLKRFAAAGIRIRSLYTCPHGRADACDCRKPAPGFAWQAAIEHGVSLEHAFAVGDHPHDVAFATRFGGRGVYVLTGHGARHRAALPDGVTVAVDLPAAAAWIRAHAVAVPAGYLTLPAAATILRDGGVVAMPTETVYGLAANARDEQAVWRIFNVKRRPLLDPLIVHLADAESLPMVAATVPEAARRLAARFWPGPLTLVLPKQSCIPDGVTAGRGSVAVRVPSHPVARALIRQAGCPVAAPSANLFGHVSPTTAAHVWRQFAASIDGVVDGGPCAVGVESTIVGWHDGKAVLLRPGGLAIERIEEEIGPLTRVAGLTPDGVPLAPGTLPHHYAPRTPLVLSDRAFAWPPGARIGRLVCGSPPPRPATLTENLSPSGDLEEAAANLYAALRRLDAAGLDGIVADPVAEQGLGVAINDRLRRAAARPAG